MCLCTTRKKKSCVPISADPQSAFLCYSVIVRITDFFLKKRQKQNPNSHRKRNNTVIKHLERQQVHFCVLEESVVPHHWPVCLSVFHKHFQSLADISHFMVYWGWYVGHYRWCRPCSKVTSNSRAFQEENRTLLISFDFNEQMNSFIPSGNTQMHHPSQPDTLNKNTEEF